jgi:hypothetical protein
MKKDARAFMKKLAELLGIDPQFYEQYDFPIKNETVTVQNPALHRGARKLNRAIPRGRLKDLLQGAYLTAQSGANGNGRSSEDRRSLLELDHHFEPFNDRLAHELGLNLSAWK